MNLIETVIKSTAYHIVDIEDLSDIHESILYDELLYIDYEDIPWSNE